MEIKSKQADLYKSQNQNLKSQILALERKIQIEESDRCNRRDYLSKTALETEERISSLLSNIHSLTAENTYLQSQNTALADSKIHLESRCFYWEIGVEEGREWWVWEEIFYSPWSIPFKYPHKSYL